MKTNNLMRFFGSVALLSLCLWTGGAWAYTGKDSRNGESLPSEGTLRVLVVFAEVTGDPRYDISTWPWEAGKMPPSAGELFDAQLLSGGGVSIGGGNTGRLPAPGGVVMPGMPVKPEKIVSGFFYDASFGKLVVQGDYYPKLVQVPYNKKHSCYVYDEMVMNILSSESNLKSKTGLDIPADFDAWTPTDAYEEKKNQPDGKIDNIMIIWRINSALTTVNGSGHAYTEPSSSNGNFRANYIQSMVAYDFLTTTVIPHEFSHELLGSNQYHNGGAGGGRSHIMTNVGGYGILSSYNCNLRSCTAWDRYRLGWKKNKNYPDIYACNTAGEVVSGEVPYHIPTAAELKMTTVPTTREYVLRDFMETGDALRIRLPYLEQGGASVDPQWIWLENHAKDTGLLYYALGGNPRPLGVRVNLQIGGDDFKNTNNYYYMRTNYYVPFSRFGRWDFSVSRTFANRVKADVIDLPFIPFLDSNIWSTRWDPESYYYASTFSGKNNAFTGNSLLEFLNYDANGDGRLQDNESYNMKRVYKDNVQIGSDYPIFGNAYDAFQVGDELTLATNPATTPWLTHQTEDWDICTGTDARDNRKIYLNGLKIRIKEKRADGSVVVAVTQGYYTVGGTNRWCGDIVLNEKISLNAGGTIRLTLGETPVVKENPLVIGGKRYYTEPTVLTGRGNSVMSLGSNAVIEVDSLCALVLKRGSIIERQGTSGTVKVHIKSGGTLKVESGASIGKGVMFVLDKGAYACFDTTLLNRSNLSGGGAYWGIHPYVQQTTGLYCQALFRPKSGAAESEPDTLPTVYQSFFEGNPVYKQVGENQTSCGYYIPIYKIGLKGDTIVDSLLYHKLSVRSGFRGDKGCEYWVRESDNHDKVWVRLPWDTDGQEFLVVDMNLKERDSFQMYGYAGIYPNIQHSDTTYYLVDSVYYQEHPGGVLKHIRLSPQDNNVYTDALERAWLEDCEWRSRHLEFIEGVGSNLGFVYHRAGVSDQDSLWGRLSLRTLEAPADYIICMERDGTVFYEHPNAECRDCSATVFKDWVANESVLSLSPYLQLFPNPASAYVTMRWAEDTDQRVERTACRIALYNMQGVKLRTMTTTTWPYTFSVADLPSGAYLLRVVPAETTRPEEAWQATVRLMVQ